MLSGCYCLLSVISWSLLLSISVPVVQKIPTTQTQTSQTKTDAGSFQYLFHLVIRILLALLGGFGIDSLVMPIVFRPVRICYDWQPLAVIRGSTK